MPYLKANHLLLKNTVMSFQLGWPSEIKEKSTQWAGLQMRNLSLTEKMKIRLRIGQSAKVLTKKKSLYKYLIV